MPLTTTPGQILINRELPENLRDYNRELKKSSIKELLSRVAKEHPDQYKRISHFLLRLGNRAASETGGLSPSPVHLRKSETAMKNREIILRGLLKIYTDKSISREERRKKVLELVGGIASTQANDVFHELLAKRNPLALQVYTGSRGNPSQLNSLVGADLLYANQKGEPIPFPILHSYAEGLSPSEYWIASYGARKGIVDPKLATRDAGYLCLAYDQGVRMADGSIKAICDIKPGDEVASVDEKGQPITVPVTKLFENGSRQVFRWIFRDTHSHRRIEFRCTAEHKVMGADFKMRPVQDSRNIYVDDTSTWQAESGEFLGQTFILEAAELESWLPTYDIEVDHPMHCFVLDCGAVVSNSKQLVHAAHRGVIVGADGPEYDPNRGWPTDVEDEENIGALLARPVGPYPANTVITHGVLRKLKESGIKRMLVRSPMVGGPADGSLYSRDVGVRETGQLPRLGENPSVTAVQALSEPITQAQLSSKHSGGVATDKATQAVSGFAGINQQIQVPKIFQGGAVHADVTGRISSIVDAPAGGKHIQINDHQLYVPEGYEILVKPGQEVEAGDVMTEGIPNPAQIVKYKGIGAGRAAFVSSFLAALKRAGASAHRRNVELLAKGLINHVRFTDLYDEFVPDDIIPYQALEARYRPRDGFEARTPKRAIGWYLEKPLLHYSIGTRIQPSMLKDFEDFGINELTVHKDPPPFEPEMIRGAATLQHDPDWLVRMYGSGLKRGLLKGVAKGDESNIYGSSFVPGLAHGFELGEGRIQPRLKSN